MWSAYDLPSSELNRLDTFLLSNGLMGASFPTRRVALETLGNALAGAPAEIQAIVAA
jgi:hypothetical protein